MNETNSKPKINGNIWKVTTVVVLVTAGVAWGALGNRVKQAENDISELKEMYRETSTKIGIMQVDIGKIGAKLGIE